jgi:hypothetical protein
MILKIDGIRELGNLEKERLVLTAKEDGSIGKLVIGAVAAPTGSSEKGPSAFFIDFGFWLPSINVKANDLVVIYTKTGQPKTKENVSGRTTHFYYMGRDGAAWECGRSVAIFEVDTWDYFLPNLRQQEEEE